MSEDFAADEDVNGLSTDEDTVVPLSWFVNKACLKSVLAFIASASCFFAFFALIAKRHIRENGYNLYIIFLIFPDGLQTLVSGGLFNVFIAMEGGAKHFPPLFYYFDVGIWFFYYYSNCFLNAIVAYEINRLVYNSYKRKRTRPPTASRVYKQVGIVYLVSLFLSLSMVFPVPWAMFTITDPVKGQGDMGGAIFGELASTCIAFGLILLPMIYVLYIRAMIARKNLLPSRGRTRVLSLFFMRIIIVFLLFYLPNTIMTAIVPGKKGYTKFWMQAFLGTISSAQALVNLYMITLKGDIREALRETVKSIVGSCPSCRFQNAKKKEDSTAKMESSSGSGPSSAPRPSGGSRPIESSSKADESGDIENQIVMENYPSQVSTIETGRTTSEWEEEDVYESPEERAERRAGGSGKSLARRILESGPFKAPSSQFKASTHDSSSEASAGIFKSEEMIGESSEFSSEAFVRRLSAVMKPMSSTAFSIDECNEDGLFMPEEEKTSSGHFFVRRVSAKKPTFESTESTDLLEEDDGFNSEEKHTFESTKDAVESPVDLHKVPSTSSKVLETSQSSAKMRSATSDASLLGRMRANVSDGLLARVFKQKYNSKDKLHKMTNDKGGVESAQILKNAMSSFDPTVDVLGSPTPTFGKGKGGAQNASWGAQSPPSHPPESPFSRFLPENSSGHKNNTSILSKKPNQTSPMRRKVRFSTNSKSSSTMDDALRLYKKQSTPQQSSSLQPSEQPLQKNSQSMVTFGKRDIDSLLPPLTSGSDSSRSLHNASFNLNRNTPSNTLPLQKETQPSLLHQTCRLYPTVARVVESALRVTPGAVRQPITPTLEKGQANQNTYGYPLNIALSHGGSLEVIKVLAKAAPEILLEEDGPDGSRSLDIAFMFKYDWPVISMLLRTNVECSQMADRRGNYPLHIATSHGLSLDIIRTVYRLFSRALKMRNCDGDTPLDIAQRSCSEDVKAFLKDEAFSSVPELAPSDSEYASSSLSLNCRRVDMDGSLRASSEFYNEASG